MKEPWDYAYRNRWTGFGDTCNDMIIRIIITEREWLHGITVIKKNRYGCSLGLGKISALWSSNASLPGEHHRLRSLFGAFSIEP